MAVLRTRTVQILNSSPLTSHESCHRPHIPEKVWFNVYGWWGLDIFSVVLRKMYNLISNFFRALLSLLRRVNCPSDRLQVEGK